MLKLEEFTIGCDPEVFLKRNGENVSATETCVKGTKENPYALMSGFVQVDGTALEFNTLPVSLGNFEQFNNSVLRVIKETKTLIGTDFNFDIRPTVTYSPEYWEKVPESAKELGCNPDWNAYTGERNPRPDGASTTMRTGAGHIHIGWGKDIPEEHPDHLEICRDIVKDLDFYVGFATLLFDDDKERRSLYGRAGAFRPKSYGVEYRVPSNAWLTTLPRRKLIWTALFMCINNKLRGYDIRKTNFKIKQNGFNLTDQLIQNTINNSDAGFAKECLKQVGVFFNGDEK